LLKELESKRYLNMTTTTRYNIVATPTPSLTSGNRDWATCRVVSSHDDPGSAVAEAESAGFPVAIVIGTRLEALRLVEAKCLRVRDAGLVLRGRTGQRELTIGKLVARFETRLETAKRLGK
jgi:hypothetical protein